MQNIIIQSPEYEEAERQISRLKTELSMAIAQRDELKYVICPNIEAQYMTSIGDLEYTLFCRKTECLRLKRKIELIQTKLNCQKKIDVSDIETQLDIEYADYQKQMDEFKEKLNQSLQRKNAKFLTAAETEQVKQLYHRIVKKLHPDLHPDVTPEQIAMLQSATEAYKNGDLSALRVIDTLLQEEKIMEEDSDSMERMQKQIARLKESIALVHKDMEHIESIYPYTEQELLLDEGKIKEKRDELQLEIDRMIAAKNSYELRIKEMMN